MAKPKVRIAKLKAKQIMTFQHPDGGGEGLMMIDSKGDIYLRSDNGWIPFDMEVANVDPTV